MAEFTHVELMAARKARFPARWQLAQLVGVSEDTIERWETGKQRPEPDDVWNIEKATGATGIWHKWMLSHYDSYRATHSDLPDDEGLTNNIVRMKYELRDVEALIEYAERDALDGKLDDVETRRKFVKELPEAIAAAQKVLELLSKDV